MTTGDDGSPPVKASRSAALSALKAKRLTAPLGVNASAAAERENEPVNAPGQPPGARGTTTPSVQPVIPPSSDGQQHRSDASQPSSSPRTRGTTGERLAALKARRATVRVSSGRRGQPGRSEASSDPLNEGPPGTRVHQARPQPRWSSTDKNDDDDGPPPPPSGEWGGVIDGRAASMTRDGVASRDAADDNGEAPSTPPAPSRPPQTIGHKLARGRPGSGRGSPGSLTSTPGRPPKAPPEAATVTVLVHRASGSGPTDPSTTTSEPLRVAPSKDRTGSTNDAGVPGVELTLTRPKTTVSRAYKASAAVTLDGSLADGEAAFSIASDAVADGFGEAARDAVVGGISCAVLGLGIRRCGVSGVLRGGGEGRSGEANGAAGAADRRVAHGVCGLVAAEVFAAADRVRERTGDDVMVSVQAVADVITAPVESKLLGAARRKTHEVLRDALAVGLELTANPGCVVGSNPVGDGVRRAFFGPAEVPSLGVREHPRHGFFVEGAVELVARDAGDVERLVGAALAGFEAEEAAARDGHALSVGGAGGGAERVHCVLQVNVRRRSAGGGVYDADGAFLPDTETLSTVQVVDMAGVDRRKPTGVKTPRGTPRGNESGAAEDAALKALSRVFDSLSDARSHVPYRDSKLTRVMAASLGGRGRLTALVGVSSSALRFEESDAMLQLARKIAGVRSRPAPDATAYAARSAEAARTAAEAAEAAGVSLTGLTSAGVELDMDSSDELLALRDALAEGEALRREAGAWTEVKERSDRLRRRVFGE